MSPGKCAFIAPLQIAGENSINFELNFQILSDDRGPGPLSSDEIWEFNSKFIDFSPAIEATRRSCTPGVQICLTQSSLDSITRVRVPSGTAYPPDGTSKYYLAPFSMRDRILYITILRKYSCSVTIDFSFFMYYI